MHASFENCNIHEAHLQQANLTHACIYEKVIQVGPVVRSDYVTYFIERDIIESPWFNGSLKDLKDFIAEEEDLASRDKGLHDGLVRVVKILETCK